MHTSLGEVAWVQYALAKQIANAAPGYQVPDSPLPLQVQQLLKQLPVPTTAQIVAAFRLAGHGDWVERWALERGHPEYLTRPAATVTAKPAPAPAPVTQATDVTTGQRLDLETGLAPTSTTRTAAVSAPVIRIASGAPAPTPRPASTTPALAAQQVILDQQQGAFGGIPTKYLLLGLVVGVAGYLALRK